eukprot:1388243-Amphidinium_carterae.1
MSTIVFFLYMFENFRCVLNGIGTQYFLLCGGPLSIREPLAGPTCAVLPYVRDIDHLAKGCYKHFGLLAAIQATTCP